MGVRKDPFTGEIVFENTRPAESSGRTGQPRDSNATRPVRGGGTSPFDMPTVRMRRDDRDGKEPPGPAADTGERTRIFRPRPGRTGPEPDRPAADDVMADPITGWLVVIAGPGKGQVCRLGYGSNTLGRAAQSRVRLDFGDEQISRDAHATLTYDPRGRKYYLQHNGGTNLTYIGDEPVLTPTLLRPMQDIFIGATTLRFVPFCGPDFDWQDLEEGT